MNWKKTAYGFAVALVLTLITAMQMQDSQKPDMVELAGKEQFPFSLPKLPFAYDALEPSIDAKTVDIHYNRHHKAYVDALNKAVKGSTSQNKDLDTLIRTAGKLPASIRNNAGGHWNHTFYWSILRSAENNPGPSAKLIAELTKNFGSFDEFKKQFKEAGVTDFGSGWAWLVRLPDGSLQVYASHNQDNPLMDISKVRGKPILACDVWEHAYYLKYLNRRDEYMDNFWNIIDWERVEALLNTN